MHNQAACNWKQRPGGERVTYCVIGHMHPGLRHPTASFSQPQGAWLSAHYSHPPPAAAAEAPKPNAIFDESGNFLLYSTLLGIKVGPRLLHVLCTHVALCAGEYLARAATSLLLYSTLLGIKVRGNAAFNRLAHLLQLKLRCMLTVHLLTVMHTGFHPMQVVNLVSNRLVKIVGKVENTERFLRIALYQVRICAFVCSSADVSLRSNAKQTSLKEHGALPAHRTLPGMFQFCLQSVCLGVWLPV